MKILKSRGFSDFRLPASDPDFRSFPGNFDRKLPETDVLRGSTVGDHGRFFPARPTSSFVTNRSRGIRGTIERNRSQFLNFLIGAVL